MKRLGWLLFALTIIYFIFLIRQDIIDNLDLKKQTRSVSDELLREQKKAVDLHERLRALKGDDYIEELARTRLGMIKKGETPFKVVEQGVK